MPTALTPAPADLLPDDVTTPPRPHPPAFKYANLADSGFRW
jgi:hypothetical protein